MMDKAAERAFGAALRYVADGGEALGWRKNDNGTT
jgi:hypothetical protein